MKQLNLIERAFFLKKIALCHDLDFEVIIAIAEKLNQDFYEKNEKIFETNQIGSRIYFITAGKVDLIDKYGSPIITLSEESFFGDEALFNEQPRSYSAICAEKTHLMTLSKANLMNLISECPTVAIALLQYYAQNNSCRYKK